MKASQPSRGPRDELVQLRAGPLSRRRFLQLLSAVGFAGLPGCFRPAPEEVAPYGHQPEAVRPGNPLHYASTLTFGALTTGVVVTSHEGRPTKIEGNPLHPDGLGATGIWEQAALLDLYDPHRLATITEHGRAVGRANFLEHLRALGEQLAATHGAGLHLLLGPTTSPLIGEQLARVQRRFPATAVHTFQPVAHGNAARASQIAFGAPLRQRAHLDRADVIVSLDGDFLSFGPDRLRLAREWADRRIDPSRMNRLYVAETELSLAGSVADHRLPARPSELPSIAVALLHELGSALGGAPTSIATLAPGPISEAHRIWLRAVAKDLTSHRTRAVVLCEGSTDMRVHLAVLAMNALLANGTTELIPSPELFPGAVPQDIADLVTAMRAGQVKALVSTAFDPAGTVPVDLDFAGALRSVEDFIVWSPFANATTARARWMVPAAHALESWGDARASDGTVSLCQPLIGRMYDSFTEAELLSALVDPVNRSDRELLEASWRNKLGSDFGKRWRSALQDGVLSGSAAPAAATSANWPAIADALARPPRRSPGAIELRLAEDRKVRAGEFAHNAWIQECPDPITQLAWDNALLLSPATAAQLKLETGAVVEIEAGGQVLRAPVLHAPGHADGAATLHLGYGRTVDEGEGPIGVDAYLLRTREALDGPISANIRQTGARHDFAQIQIVTSDQARPLALNADPASLKDGLAHIGEHRGEAASLYQPFEYPGYRWAMAVDLSRCIGCQACVIACQAENNVPVVGRDDVRRGREMHWLRVDRYFAGSPERPEVRFHPLMCVHCENAPCEYVCPVNATVHSDEGLNEMVYNRCVGTRYCSNNCPYKVRRFNWRAYTKDTPETVQLAMNPEVTVRSRGVMEKCTYCVQRIERARIGAELEGRSIRPDEIRTACQQACPTRTIVFGSLSHADAEVTRLHGDERRYDLLHELGTRPRTAYLARLTHKNPEL